MYLLDITNTDRMWHKVNFLSGEMYRKELP